MTKVGGFTDTLAEIANSFSGLDPEQHQHMVPSCTDHSPKRAEHMVVRKESHPDDSEVDHVCRGDVEV